MPFHPPRHGARSRSRRWLPIVLGAVLCYLASYIAFSSWGQFVSGGGEPDDPPRWAPGEFYDFSRGRWKRSHTLVYAPLLWLDQRLWHVPNR